MNKYVKPTIKIELFTHNQVIKAAPVEPTYDESLQPSVPDQSIPEYTEDVP